MMNMKNRGVVVVALAAAMTIPSLASAAPAASSDAKILAGQIEATIRGLGCDASAQSDLTALQATIAASGDDPSDVRAALGMARSALPAPGSSDYCSNITTAYAAVSQTIVAALTFSAPQAGGAPWGGPIGAPPTNFSSGGSDYLPR